MGKSIPFIVITIWMWSQIAHATEIVEDAEDRTTAGWSVRSGEDATIRNVWDNRLSSRVIELNGNGTNDAYILGAETGNGAWNNRTDRFITWRMGFSENSVVYVAVQTRRGLRYLFYTPSHNRGLLHGFAGGIHHGLGSAVRDGRWRTITRDLVRDLHDAEPENELISVNAFIVRGSGRVDNIILFNADEQVYENGNNGTNRWRISDNTPRGARIRNITDNDRQRRHLQGRVISLIGNGFNNAYRIGGRTADVWNDRRHQILQWRFRNFGPNVEVINPRGIIRDARAFEFRVFVQTEQGLRELVYTVGEENRGRTGITIHHGLGDDRIRGSVWAGDNPRNELGLWQAVTRDLDEDIRDFEPDNRLVAINGLQVRGRGLVDDIKTYARFSEEGDDGEDNGGGDDRSSGERTYYEDAENGNTEGWSLYDSTPAGAEIKNVVDEESGSRVIMLSGEGTDNGYMLGGRTGTDGWNKRTNNTIRWSMNYEESFVIYIPIETRNGRRYLVYTPHDNDRGVSGAYLRFGLGANADNGGWRTFTRNVIADLRRLEPGNELISVNGLMIRGSGYLDNISMLSLQ